MIHKCLRTRARLKGKLFINFNPSSIYDPSYCLRATASAIDEIGIKANDVVFEVTETQKATDINNLKGILAFYRTAGFQVALDDIGSGWSGLNLMQETEAKFRRKNVRKMLTETIPKFPGSVPSELMPDVIHDTSQYANNKAELSHQPTRVRKRVMRKFKSMKQGQSFLSAHAEVYNPFNVGRHYISAKNYKMLRSRAIASWKSVTASKRRYISERINVRFLTCQYR